MKFHTQVLSSLLYYSGHNPLFHFFKETADSLKVYTGLPPLSLYLIFTSFGCYFGITF